MLGRVDRVDTPQQLAARAQDLIGQAVIHQFLTGHAEHETQPEDDIAPVDDQRYGQPPGQSRQRGGLAGAPSRGIGSLV
jgi:hypothetical protein